MNGEVLPARRPGPAPAILNLPNNLTEPQKMFCDHWLATRNGTESARVAGYKGDDTQLAIRGSQLLRVGKVQEYLNKHLHLSMMSADEVLKRLSKQGRADIADVLTEAGEFDFKKAKKRGTTDLIRKLKIKKTRRVDLDTNEETEETTHELELHNSQSALELMGKHHRLFADVQEVSVTVEHVESDRVLVLLVDALSDAVAVAVTPGTNTAELLNESLVDGVS